MKISVIVCTFDRPKTVVRCLASIVVALEAALPAQGEIIVVDNGSVDDTNAVIQAWMKTVSCKVHLLVEPMRGVSAARNCGIAAASGELLAFTDDDCIMDINFIKDALSHDADDTELVLRGGRVNLGDASDLPLTVKTEDTPKRWELKNNSARHENLGGSLLGCNMVMRRELMNILHGFDVTLGAGQKIPSAEDTDLIYRAYLANVPVEYVPDMAVSHFHGRKLPSDGRKLLHKYSMGTGALSMKYLFVHPNLARPFYWDLKDAIREIAANRNNHLPEIGFSYKDRVLANAHGAAIFAAIYIRQRFHQVTEKWQTKFKKTVA